MKLPWSKCALIPLCLLGFTPAVASGADAVSPERLRFLKAAQESVPDGGDRTASPYFFVFSDEPDTDRLPLKSTRADVHIAGVIAEVRIEQVYRNDGRNKLEAVYIFPLSTRAAVYAMKMTIGDRTIVAKIKKRKEAREDYEKARDEGRTASLLEQQRPNVFQMNVANILPGDEVRVEVAYAELLVPEEGQYEFVYPAVVGPRYSTTTEKWVENPYLHEGEAPTYTFALDATLRSGIPIARMASPSHGVDVEYEGKQVASVHLPEGHDHGNRDFVLRYALAGDVVEHGLLLYPGEKESFFLLMMEPPERVRPRDVLPREYIFILDVSGSMYGYPLDTAKELMHTMLKGLGEGDTFNILLFAGQSALLAPRSLPASAENMQEAFDLVASQQGGGGTELLPALKRAMQLPRDEDLSRTVVIITDGYVTVEAEAFELIRKNLDDANVFTFGIGAGVNRHLIEGMARVGLGEPFVVTKPEEAGKQARRFREYVSAPVMTDIEVSFEDFDVYDTEPLAMPDLFAARPLVVFGKYRGEAKGSVLVSGRAAENSLKGRVVVVEDADASGDNAALRLLWARHRITRLADLSHLDAADERVEEVTGLGMKYGLMTKYTSFVAVDTEVRADGKKSTRVRQPLPLPAGLSDYAVGGGGLALHGSGQGGGGIGIRPRAAMVQGSLGRHTISRVIRKNVGQIQRVYQRALKSNPNISGKIVVSFIVGPDGKVKNARVTYSTIPDPQFQAAILKIVRGWKFPKPAGGGSIHVSYPFIFRAAG